MAVWPRVHLIKPMALNSSGPISLAGSTVGQSIALALGLSATGSISLNQVDVRALAGVLSGAITMPGDFWGKSSTTKKGIFGYGLSGASTMRSLTNLVSDTGVVSGDVTGIGTARAFLAACTYGGDKGIFGYGVAGTTNQSVTNLVSNTGVVSANATGVGTARRALGACSYGTDKGIFGYGATAFDAGNQSVTNLVSNVGVVSANVAGVGTARTSLAACGYGGDKGVFAYGGTVSGPITLRLISNLVSNTGVVSTDTAITGSARYDLAACTYGGDKGIFGYGSTASSLVATTNLVSNTGVISANVTGVGTARAMVAACGYGGDKGIFGYGFGGGTTEYNITNLVSNTGVVAANTTGVGTIRRALSACGYSLT